MITTKSSEVKYHIPNISPLVEMETQVAALAVRHVCTLTMINA